MPLELEFELSGRCLRGLVAHVGAKASPGLVLEALQRAGLVIRSEERHFRAVSRPVMVSAAMSSQQTEYFREARTYLAGTLNYDFNPSHLDKGLERFVAVHRSLPLEPIP